MKYIYLHFSVITHLLFCITLLKLFDNGWGGSLLIQITNRFRSYYDVEFDKEQPPLVRIPYQLSDGINKAAIFQLDGYDSQSKIGYKLVLADDINEWDERLSKNRLLHG